MEEKLVMRESPSPALRNGGGRERYSQRKGTPDPGPPLWGHLFVVMSLVWPRILRWGHAPWCVCQSFKCRRTQEGRDTGWLSPKETRGRLCISGPHWAQPGSFYVSELSHKPGKMWVSTEMLNEGMNYVSLAEPGTCSGVISRRT